MVDLAVPRDVEPEVAELDDVFLYSVDDLADIVKEGLDSRQGAVAQAEAIIDSNVVNFMHWLESREVGAHHTCAAGPGRTVPAP